MIDIKYKSLKILRIHENNGFHIEISTFLFKNKKQKKSTSWERDFCSKSQRCDNFFNYNFHKNSKQYIVIIYIRMTAILCI